MTVFIFTDKFQKILGTAKGNLFFDVFLILIGLSVLVYAVYRTPHDKARYIVIGSLFLLLYGNWFIDEIQHYNFWKNEYSKLTSVYHNNEYEIVEGYVTVLHEQPEHGHDAGDIILVNGVEFELSCYSDTFGYNRTIVYGGVLTEGAFARIYYYRPVGEPNRNIVILQIDMIENENKPAIPSPSLPLPCVGW